MLVAAGGDNVFRVCVWVGGGEPGEGDCRDKVRVGEGVDDGGLLRGGVELEVEGSAVRGGGVYMAGVRGRDVDGIDAGFVGGQGGCGFGRRAAVSGDGPGADLAVGGAGEDVV